MEIGDVILFKTEEKSFSWSNGLYVFLYLRNNDIHMCCLDKDGNPSKFDDGRWMETITSIKNPNVFPTNLKHNLKDYIPE